MTVICLLCPSPRRVDSDEILDHLREKHELDIDAPTWPDGVALDLEDAA